MTTPPVNSRAAAVQRSAEAKQKELMRRGSPPGNARKHAGNMVAQQSTGDPTGEVPSY